MLAWFALLYLSANGALGQQGPTTCELNLCRCSSATGRADCRPDSEFSGRENFQFTSIPQDLPEDIRTLIMAGNALSSLAPDSFSRYQSLATLDLSQNFFTTVPSESFVNLSITSLTLDSNPITEIEATAFQSLTSLQSLSLRRIPMVEELVAFQGPSSLQTLQLDDNLLDSLPVDLLNGFPQLSTLTLTNNGLETLPDGFLTPVSLLSQLDLSGNPWSCDCNLRWLRSYLDTSPILTDDSATVCHWPLPPSSSPQAAITSVAAANFLCYPPSVVEHPVNVSILSNLTLVIPCVVNAAPFPDVTWLKDGMEVNLTTRVNIQRYDASLRFENQTVEDSGSYQCLLTNSEGSTSSSVGVIVVLESTCFDNALTPSHETDLDCGGEFCVPCNLTQNCLLDRDCVGGLVCLYSHALPNSLHYISSSHEDAYTCSDAEVPGNLLESILTTQLPLELADTLVGDVNSETLHSSVRDYLATLLETPRVLISNVRLTSVEKIERPLIQIWFDLPGSAQGDQSKSNILAQIDSGNLKATVRIKEEDGFIRCRLNL